MIGFAGFVTMMLGLVLAVFFGWRAMGYGTRIQKFTDGCLAGAGLCAAFTGLMLVFG